MSSSIDSTGRSLGGDGWDNWDRDIGWYFGGSWHRGVDVNRGGGGQNGNVCGCDLSGWGLRGLIGCLASCQGKYERAS